MTEQNTNRIDQAAAAAARAVLDEAWAYYTPEPRLVSVRDGRLSPTRAALRCGHDAQALWHHVVGRLPLGSSDAERHAGWMALAVVGSGAPAQEWRSEISDLLFALGWRSGHDRVSSPPPDSATLDVLLQLAGASPVGWRPRSVASRTGCLVSMLPTRSRT